MSSTFRSGSPLGQRYARQKNEEYAAYVSRIEKTTSMTEGPHFPNLCAVYKHKDEFDQEADLRSRTGRFGKAVHLERLDDKTKQTY
ncbi:hypothetical protein Cni_G27538 [Canna indica]|uniref:Uncharacterized protein n=1 Tax=Canna indica TaxID=4628 RepID=A0AAQ3QN18_9LILI|nr:hypothetical protein Cni_G27538 [Canna indica]